MKWRTKQLTIAEAANKPQPPKPRAREIPVHWITLWPHLTETESIEAYCRTHSIAAGDGVILRAFIGPKTDADILARGGNLPWTPAFNAACAEALLRGIGPAAREIKCPAEIQVILRQPPPPSRQRQRKRSASGKKPEAPTNS